MGSSKELQRQHLAKIVLYTILFLFFFQLISEFVEAIYAFGLLGTGIPIEIVSVLLLCSPLLLLCLPRGLSGWPLVLVGELMLISRVVEVLLDTQGRMLVGGLGVACFLLLLPSLLWNKDDEKAAGGGRLLGLALTAGLLLSIFFRTLGSGRDISTFGWFQTSGWFLAIFAGVLLLRVRRPVRVPARPHRPDRSPIGRTVGLCLGLTGALLLCYFAFASPNVIARWTGARYLPIVSIASLVLGLFALLLAARPQLLAGLTPRIVLAWNLFFVLVMAMTILGHQIGFPASPDAYPLSEPPVTPLHHIPLFLMLVLSPVIPLDFLLFSRQLLLDKPSPRALGIGFSLASLYLLFMILAQVFTTVYDYIPVVGPFFRDKFWFVFLLAGAALGLPVLLVDRDAFQFSRASDRWRANRAFSGLMVLIVLATIAGAFLTAASPVAPEAQKSPLRILTYNIQQGYSQEGLRNYDGQLALLRELDADIIGLQESDTNRIAGGNADVVRYFADRLDLYSYYGPKTVPGTFGIALLSRYPIDRQRTFYMYSEGEQTATIEAQITVDGQRFHIFVTHLGNGGPIVQQEAILKEVQGKENVILLGDFNFRPGSEQYRLTTRLLADSWLLKWPGGTADQGIDQARRIDHIFVSPGTRVADSQYWPRPESDHPAMTTTIEW